MKLQDFVLRIMNQAFSESENKTQIWKTSWFMICNSNSWSRSSGKREEAEEVRAQEEEKEEKFCWVWRAKLTILVALSFEFGCFDVSAC